MAPSATTVLLPKVFPTDLVSIGQLVRNPLTPNVDTYLGGCAVIQPSDVSTPDPEVPYSAIISTDARHRFDVGLPHLLGINFGGRKTNLLSVDAESLQLRTIKDTAAVFRRICSSEEARAWINDMVLHKAPCYFVVGLQVLNNAEFTRAVLAEGGGGAHVKLPLDPAQEIPIHIQGDLSASDFGSSVGKKVTGVFGIQVQRLDHRIAPASEPKLKADISWKWTYQRVKGSQKEDDKSLNITLAETTLDELLGLLQKDREDDEDEEE